MTNFRQPSADRDPQVKDELRLLENEIYAVLYVHLLKHEERGFNSHTKAQNMAEYIGREFVFWVNQNRRRREDDKD